MDFFETALNVEKYIRILVLLINIIFALIIVFVQKKEPKSIWAWLLLLFFLPMLGCVIYLFAGTDMHKKKMFRLKEIKDRIHDAVEKQEEKVLNKKFPENRSELEEYADLILYNLQAGGNVLTDHNKIAIFTNGNDKFQSLTEDLKKAKESIHLQYYIIKPANKKSRLN